MSMEDCLRSARDQGALDDEGYEDLARRWREILGEGADPQSAKEALARELRAQAAEARRLAQLTKTTRARIAANLRSYRDHRGRPDVLSAAAGHLEHFGFHGFSSVEGRYKAIVGMAHAQLEEGLMRYRRTVLLGRRVNKPELDDVVRARFGEGTSSPEAKLFADLFGELAETLRQRFNAAGGQVGKLDDWGLPQWHDARAVVSAGRDTWKTFIKPLLDPARMRDPLTGQPLSASRLEEALDVVYERIVTDGRIERDPTGQRYGASLAKQRADHRFLVFKDSGAWQSYAEAFGNPDTFATMMNHIRGMARDIAALEVLGPNPSATVEWLIQTVENQQARATVGKPSLFQAGSEAEAFLKGATARWRLENLWAQVRGGEVVSSRMAHGAAAIRNVITSAVLGSATVLAVSTDPFIANAARRLSQMPTRTWLADVARTFTAYDRKEAVRAGLMLDDALFILGSEARYVGSMAGPTWSRWLADRTLTLSGLTPWTQARKHLFGMEFQAFFADLVESGTAWADMPPSARRALEGYGIREVDWATLATVPIHRATPDAGGILRPAEIAGVDGRLAERYLEAILQETERAVPAGTKRSRAILEGNTRAGTLLGEFLRGALQFKSFALSFTWNQIEAIARESGSYGLARGARYAGSLMLGLTMGGFLGLQLKQLINGKDPLPATDVRTWQQSMLTGGGLGIFGDFLFADMNRFGQSPWETLLGPTIGAFSDANRVTVGNLQKAAQGEEVTFAQDVVQRGGRYVPMSSLWYLRLGYQRVFLDQLTYLADPTAHRRFREAERRIQRETGQGYWWAPGEGAPQRAPDLGVALEGAPR